MKTREQDRTYSLLKPYGVVNSLTLDYGLVILRDCAQGTAFVEPKKTPSKSTLRGSAVKELRKQSP